MTQMTQDHVDVLGRALWAGQTFTLAETLLLANIETLVRGLAEGSLRCADATSAGGRVKMTQDHVAEITNARRRTNVNELANRTMREIELLVRSLADGSLRCADSKTEVVVDRGELEDLRHDLDLIYRRAAPGSRYASDLSSVRRLAARWLSTPEHTKT